jgi:hypothetical protein
MKNAPVHGGRMSCARIALITTGSAMHAMMRIAPL